jgi:isoaspartyl peptidase/L-asparaginase-like protein (Ntn-hydrolase superfamily)
MAQTDHIYLVGPWAKRFALEHGFEERDLLTEQARRTWEQWKAQNTPNAFREQVPAHDTVGLIGVDPSGEAAVGMSTSGLPFKLPGRVGDSPLVGAGGYADHEVGAVAATGVGEEVIRVVGSHAVLEAMRRGDSPEQAARSVLERLLRRREGTLQDDQVAFIAVRRDGEVGAAALKPGFSYAVHRDGATMTREVTPLQTI